MKNSLTRSARLSKARGILPMLALAASTTSMAAGDLVLAIGRQPETLDPYNTNTTLTMAVTKSFYQGLFEFDKDLKIQNVLAESFTVTKDGLQYTLKLREGVKFHDGTDFNAQAVKETLDRVTNPESKLARYNQFNRIASVDALTPLSVRITLGWTPGPTLRAAPLCRPAIARRLRAFWLAAFVARTVASPCESSRQKADATTGLGAWEAPSAC